MQGRDRSMKERLVIVLGVLLGVAVNVAAQGPVGPRGPMGPPPGQGGLPPLFMRIELTEQQRSQIHVLVEEQRDSRRADMEERRTLQQQLTSAIYGGTDTDSMAATVARLAELQKQALDADVALHTKVAALLTDDQRQQIVALEAARPAPRQRSR